MWAGTIFRGAGMMIQQLTLGWLVYDLTGSAVLLGALSALRMLPFLVFGPLGGVIADRVDRRRLITSLYCLFSLLSFGMGSLVALRLVEVWHLFAFVAISGVMASFLITVEHSIIPNTVPREELMNAVALDFGAFNTTRVIAPVLGGFLIPVFGAAGNLFVESAVTLCAACVTYLLQLPPVNASGKRSSVFANLKEGVRYLRSNPLVVTIMIVALVPAVFAMPHQALMPIFQKDVLGVGPEGLGFMVGAPGLGAVLGMLFLATIARGIQRKGLFLLSSMTLLGLSLIFFSQSASFALTLVALMGVGGFHALFGATKNTMVQLTVPDELRGRVNSLFLLERGLTPAGSFLAGVAAHYFGAPVTVAVMGSIVVLLAGVVLMCTPQIRARNILS